VQMIGDDHIEETNGQRADIMDNGEVGCDNVQMIADDHIEETNEQRPAKKLRLIPPPEGEGNLTLIGSPSKVSPL
jgi:hypothetical protein